MGNIGPPPPEFVGVFVIMIYESGVGYGKWKASIESVSGRDLVDGEYNETCKERGISAFIARDEHEMFVKGKGSGVLVPRISDEIGLQTIAVRKLNDRGAVSIPLSLLWIGERGMSSSGGQHKAVLEGSWCTGCTSPILMYKGLLCSPDSKAVVRTRF